MLGCEKSLPLVALCVAAALTGCANAGGQSETPDQPPLTVAFHPAGGTFVSTQTVTLDTAPDAEIHYTTDGSLPTAASPRYVNPVVVERSTQLRAVAIRMGKSAASGAAGSSSDTQGLAGSPGLVPIKQGVVQSSSYLRLTTDSAAFTSHLPILLIHTFGTGNLDQDSNEFVPARLQVLDVTNGVAHALGRATLDTRVGIHVRGETSRNYFPKKAYALETWAETADIDVDQQLLGMPAESDWVLSDPITQDRTSIRNALAYLLSNRIGRYAPRTRFAEVYLATHSGDIRAQDFAGFYTVIEKIKRGPSRVNVDKISGGETLQDLSGGYLLRDDKGTTQFVAAIVKWQFVYPDASEMLLPNRAEHLDFIRDYIEGFGESLAASDFKNPTTAQHYSDYIDVDSFIDHNIVNALLKNVDALRLSTYYHKDRGGRLVAGPVWDFDRSSGSPYEERAVEPEEWKAAGTDGTDYLTYGFWGQLMRDPQYKSRYIERFSQLLRNEFSPDRLDAAVDSLAAEVGAAAARNFERWTDSPPRDGSHAAEIAILKDFLRRRVAFIEAELARGL